MDFYEVLNVRRSIRAYKPDPVPEESLRRIAEAVRSAPTACNRQSYKLLLIRDAAKRAEICKAYSGAFLAQAPVIAVMLCCESEAWRRLEGNSATEIDATIAMEHLVLAAAAEGLGACWICAFSRPKLDSILDIQAPYASFAVSPLGFAAAAPGPFSRKKLSDLVEIVG